jgi:hypothetical protein
MSLFVGDGPELDYPVYLVSFTMSSGPSSGQAFSFYIAQPNVQDMTNGALGGSSDIAFLESIQSWLVSNGWEGNSVSGMTATLYNETQSAVAL